MFLKKASYVTILSLSIWSITQFYPLLEPNLYGSRVLAETREERKAEAESLYQQGDKEERPLEAIIYFKQALEIYREIGDRTSEAWLLHKIGNTYNSVRNVDEGIKYLEAALELAEEIGDTSREAFVLNALGNSYILLDKAEQSLPYYRHSLRLTIEVGNESGQANTLGSLGVYYRVTGEYAKAIDYLEQAKSLFQKLGNQGGIQAAYGQLGLTYRRLGQLEEAKKALEEQLRIAREIKNLGGERAALGNLGLIHFDFEEYEKARKYHEQQLELVLSLEDRSTQATALSNLGLVYGAKGDYEQALNLYRQSEEIRLSLGQDTGNLAGQIGLLYRSMRKHRKALPYLRRYVEATKNNNDPYIHGVALNNLAVTLYEIRRYREAEKIAVEAIEVRESLSENLGDREKISINDSFEATYGLLQLTLSRRGQEDAALEIAERGRARVLVEILYSRLTQKQENLSKTVFPNLEEIKEIAKEQNATLVEYSLVPDEDDPDNFPNGAIDGRIFVWVIQPTGEIIFRSIEAIEGVSWQELVKETRESFGANGRGQSFDGSNMEECRTVNCLQKFHKLLIEPIADLLPQNEEERIIFIPHRELFFVPFAALQDAQGDYLIEKHTILTAPSIQTLSLTSTQQVTASSSLPRGEEALVVGNPVMPKLGAGKNLELLQPLPGAELEAMSIATMLDTKPLIGQQATEQTIKQKMAKARVIHLATHGLLDDINGVGSPGAIALTPSGKDDGFLTSSEILEQFGLASSTPLQAELVVLSACDTGRGSIRGEGVVGLSRSLIAAGVPSVIVSLWKVPDEATKDLMIEFYTNLYERKLDKAQALRQAMLTMLNERENPDPLNWAAFTLIGEAE